VLLFARDDARPAGHLVSEHLRLHRTHPRALALGVLGDPPGSGVPRPVEFCGQTMSVRRSDLRAVGGFAEGLEWGTEADLAFRLAGLGVSLIRLPRSVGEREWPVGLRRLAAEQAAAGRGSVELYRRIPALLPELELAAFGDAGQTALLLRRALLALGRPVWPLALLTPFVPPGEPRRRWRRFVDSYLYWRGVWQALPHRGTRRRLAHGPVILMYHAIGRPAEPSSCYVTGVRRFAAHMAWLRLAGYRVIGLNTLLDFRRRHELPPPRSVVLTFDDGYADNHDLALPVLRRWRFPATFFLVSDCIGSVNHWDAAGELAGRPLLSWTQIRAMMESGMDVGAHTRRHAALPELGDGALEDEVAGCRVELERGLGRPVRAFAYPYGQLDETSRRAVENAGYDGACCSRPGVCDPFIPDLLLRRVEVRGTDSLARFALGVWRGAVRRRRRPA
jgi:peptidoglycan/xylan/chitin deacetylase (PgdA/CDA1 family)